MTLFIAEFTTNHMGNFNVLKEMAIKAKEAGADYIKMQKKDVESYYSQDKLDQVYPSPYGKTYRDYRKIFEFDFEDFRRFDRLCKELDIPWFATVQDIASLQFMLRFNLPMYKIASSSARDWEFVREVNKRVPKHAEIIVSVAGSTLAEVKQLVDSFPKHDLIIQHCVAEYPCPLENLRLGNIDALKLSFEDRGVEVGYSGHEQGIAPSVLIGRKGIYTLERHFCLSKHSFVHHIECSLEPNEFATMIDEIRNPKMEFVIPEDAWNESFGMSEVETEFLEKQTYGNTYLKQGSHFGRYTKNEKTIF